MFYCLKFPLCIFGARKSLVIPFNTSITSVHLKTSKRNYIAKQQQSKGIFEQYLTACAMATRQLKYKTKQFTTLK